MAGIRLNIAVHMRGLPLSSSIVKPSAGVRQRHPSTKPALLSRWAAMCRCFVADHSPANREST